MRHVIACLLVLPLIGCSGDDGKSNPVTTTDAADPGTKTELVVPSSAAAPATTVAASSDSNPGSESIAITEKVTITIIDPED